MKKHEKTQATLIKIAAVLMFISFCYNVVNIDFSDLSWNTNKQTYRNIFLSLAILVGIYLDHKNWFRRQPEN